MQMTFDINHVLLFRFDECILVSATFLKAGSAAVPLD